MTKLITLLISDCKGTCILRMVRTLHVTWEFGHILLAYLWGQLCSIVQCDLCTIGCFKKCIVDKFLYTKQAFLSLNFMTFTQTYDTN